MLLCLRVWGRIYFTLLKRRLPQSGTPSRSMNLPYRQSKPTTRSTSKRICQLVVYSCNINSMCELFSTAFMVWDIPIFLPPHAAAGGTEKLPMASAKPNYKTSGIRRIRRLYRYSPALLDSSFSQTSAPGNDNCLPCACICCFLC